MLLSSTHHLGCQDHVQFLPSSTGVLPKFFPSHLVLTRVVPIPSCPLYSSFIALQPPRFTWCSLFLFSTAVLSIVFNYVMFFVSTFQPIKVLWFHSFVKEATQFYLFSSSSVSLRCHPRSRDEILLQWWSVVTPRMQLSIFVTPTLAFSGEAI